MARLKKAGIEDEFDSTYTDKDGKVTPYHILFKNYGNEIASLNKEGAIEFCIEQINELNNKYQNDPNYHYVDGEELNDFKESLENDKIKNGMDVLLEVKDFLLATEGLNNEVKEELEDNDSLITSKITRLKRKSLR